MLISEGRETKLSFHIRSELNATFQNGTLPLSQNVSTGEQIARILSRCFIKKNLSGRERRLAPTFG